MLRSAWLTSLRGLLVTRSRKSSTRLRRTRQRCHGAADVSFLESRVLFSATVVENTEAETAAKPEPTPIVASIPPLDPQLFATTTIVAEPGPFPDGDTFLLHSRPAATKKIYLDFDGYITTGTQWNIAYNMTTITTPEFTLDGVAGFNAAELTAIQQVYQRVAEAFSPFDVDVTTEDPGIEALRNTGGNDQNWGIRVAIGGSSAGVLGISAGGVAYIGSFDWNSDTPTYVFPDSLGRNEKNMADATNHEVGHTLGLLHDGLTTPVTEYYTGHGSGPTGWAPIMGVGYSKQLVQWSKGEYPSANNQEDDLNIIVTQNGFTYRSDDHGDVEGSATDLVADGSGNVAISGVIERNTDSDWFRFLGSGDINLQINNADRGGMLDIQADLYDSTGTLIATSNPVDALNATITANVAVGYYFLKIDGVGKTANGNDFGYTDYGSLGQFSVVGNVGDNFPPVINDQALSVPENSPIGTSVGTVVATDPDAGDTITYAITGGNPGNVFSINPTTGEITLNASIDHETLASYLLTVEVTDLRGLTDTGIVTINVTDVNEPPSISAQSFTVFEKSVVDTSVGTVIVDDPDIAQSKSFAIIAGNLGTAFKIDPSSGEISVNNPAAIDYNVIQTFTLTIRVIDGGTPSLLATGQVTIDVLQVNLPPAIAPQTFTLPENGPVGTVVGTVAVTDGNLNQTNAFIITGGNTGGAFQIHPVTGVIRIANAAAVNFEVTPTFQLTVQVTDNGVPPLSATGTITINLSDANDPPKIVPQVYSILEDAPANTVVGTVTATDDDAGQTRTFAITGGNTSNAFKIDANTGVISVDNPAALDFEVTPVFGLSITTTDNGAPAASSTSTVTVNVVNINDPPRGVSFANATPNLAENTALAGRVKVADVVIQDDGLGTNNLSLSGADADAFELTGNALFVKAGTTLNFEGKKTYVVTVDADDSSLGSTPDASANFTLNLIDVNEAPVVPGKTVTVAENSPVGTVVTSGLATDPDAGQSLTYAIEGGNRNNAFAINPTTGVITVNNPAALDYENEPPYELKIAARDDGAPNLKSTAIIKVVLTNANDAPSVYQATKKIPENLAAGTVVLDYKIVAKDPDVGQSLTYAIVSGNEGNAFAIHPTTGVITVNNPLELDFENQPPFNLMIAVTDNGTPALTSTALLRITLENVNDAPRVYNGAVTIPENHPAGATVLDYRIVARDQDVGQSLSFKIIGGNAGETFTIHPQTGLITVKNPAALDFETASPFNLTIAVSDDATPSLTSTANLMVKLSNVNDPPQVTTASVIILENLAVGTTVFNYATVAKDPDAGQTLKYAITSGNRNGAFQIDANSGVVTVANSAALDWENAPPFDLKISVTDSGTPALSTEGTLKVYLKNANDPPRVYNASKTIPENLPAGAVVLDYKVVARDQDTGQTLSYAITGGNTGNAFAINASTGVITVNNAAAVDFETNPQFVLTIKVTDNGTPVMSSTATLTINLTDVKEPATPLPATFTLPENSAVATPVGTVTVNLPPATGQTRTFAITGGNTGNAFTINASTGLISVNNPAVLNFEGSPSFALTVSVTDTGGTTTTGTGVITINLTNVNEAPVVPNQTLAVRTFSPVGTVVGTVAANDPDVGQSRTFAIVSGNGILNNVFRIDAATGRITVNNALGVLFAGEFNLGVRVTDNASPALSTVGTVRVVVNTTGAVPAAVRFSNEPVVAIKPTTTILAEASAVPVPATSADVSTWATETVVIPTLSPTKSITRDGLSRLLKKAK